MSVLAWHFVGETLRDGSPIPADGVTLRHKGKLEFCPSGLHASERLRDALDYAPGETLCRVECGGTIKRHDDKLVCRERTIIWRVDAADFLRLFARQCALDVIRLWDAPDIVRQYLQTGDEKLREAASDAASAASAAASAVAWAARDAAWAASASARDAASAAARDAAWAASASAWAASAAARDAQNERLEKLAYAAHEASK